MARKNLGPCAFCEESPCQCYAPAAKPKPKRKPKAEVKEAPKAKASPETIETKPKPAPEPVRKRPRRTIKKDLATHRAVQAFAGAGLLDRREAKKFAEMLNPPVTGRLQKFIGGDEDGDQVEAWHE